MFWFLLFVLTETYALQPHQVPVNPKFHVVSGAFLRYAPDTVIVYKEDTSIFFEVQFPFLTPQDYLWEGVDEHCKSVLRSGKHSALCIVEETLTDNLRTLDGRMNDLHKALTNHNSPIPKVANTNFQAFMAYKPCKPLLPSAQSTPTSPAGNLTQQHLTLNNSSDEVSLPLVINTLDLTDNSVRVPQDPEDTADEMDSFETGQQEFLAHRSVPNSTRTRRDIFDSSSYRPKRQVGIAAVAMGTFAGWIGSKI